MTRRRWQPATAVCGWRGTWHADTERNGSSPHAAANYNAAIFYLQSQRRHVDSGLATVTITVNGSTMRRWPE